MRIRILILWGVCCLAAMLLGGSVYARTPDYVDIGLRVHRHYPSGGILHFQDGFETLQMWAEVDEVPGRGWIIIIPAAPGDVKISWVGKLSGYGGRTPNYKVRRELGWLLDASRATQVYTLPSFLFGRVEAWSAETQRGNGGRKVSDTRDNVRYELIAADRPEDLVGALQKSGVEMSDYERKKVLPFADGKHAFVRIWWVGQPAAPMASAFEADPPAFSVTFPSPCPVIPLHVEHLISEENSGEYFQIDGYVKLTSDLPSGRSNVAYRQLRYFRGFPDGNYSADSGGEAYSTWTYRGEPAEVRFEGTSGKEFQEIDSYYGALCGAPVQIAMLVGWTVACSYLCGGFAGFVSMGSLSGFRGVGLWNCGTILALRKRLMGSWWVAEGMTRGRRWVFLLVFMVSYMLLCVWAEYILNDLFPQV